MFITPNFRVDKEQDSNIFSAQINEADGVDRFVVARNLATGKYPIAVSQPIDRGRVLLSPIDDTDSMWLYPNGEIKIEP